MSKELDNLHRKMVRIGIDPFTGGALEPNMDNTLPMECKICETKWNEKLKLPAPMEEAVKQIRSIRCPHCGSGNKELLIKFGAARDTFG